MSKQRRKRPLLRRNGRENRAGVAGDVFDQSPETQPRTCAYVEPRRFGSGALVATHTYWPSTEHATAAEDQKVPEWRAIGNHTFECEVSYISLKEQQSCRTIVPFEFGIR